MKLLRKELKELQKWYHSPLRKNPVVLFGARQVGKSTLAENFAKSTGRKIFTINFWKDTQNIFPKIFTKNADAKDIIDKLELHFNTKIDPENSILILDEIQELPIVYSLFKTFKEDTSLPVIATGSYLKLFLLHDEEIKIPIGCTQEHLVTPMSFGDFLQNANQKLFDFYKDFPLDKPLEELYHEKLLDHYYQYLFTGGMPEAINVFLSTKDKEGSLSAAHLTREIQKQLLSGYKNDFLTFHQKNFVVGRNVAERLSYTFDTIPKELAKYKELEKSVGRFQFTSLGKNVEFKRVHNIFEYLSLSGLIIKSYLVKKPQHPLINEDQTKNAFKCFYFDVGILHAALNVPYQNITTDYLTSYKGPIAENFVAQQLYALQKQDLFSWKETNQREIEFLYQGKDLIPIEVKSSKKSTPSLSLNDYIKKYKPFLAIKTAPRNFGRKGNLIMMPIYFIERLPELIEK